MPFIRCVFAAVLLTSLTACLAVTGPATDPFDEEHEGSIKVNKIGLKHKSTIWLVLHHQSEIDNRIKNKKYLEQGYNNGSLSWSEIKLFDERTMRYQKVNQN